MTCYLAGEHASDSDLIEGKVEGNDTETAEGVSQRDSAEPVTTEKERTADTNGGSPPSKNENTETDGKGDDMRYSQYEPRNDGGPMLNNIESEKVHCVLLFMFCTRYLLRYFRLHGILIRFSCVAFLWRRNFEKQHTSIRTPNAPCISFPQFRKKHLHSL